jgi:hypothetical protein
LLLLLLLLQGRGLPFADAVAVAAAFAPLGPTHTHLLAALRKACPPNLSRLPQHLRASFLYVLGKCAGLSGLNHTDQSKRVDPALTAAVLTAAPACWGQPGEVALLLWAAGRLHQGQAPEGVEALVKHGVDLVPQMQVGAAEGQTHACASPVRCCLAHRQTVDAFVSSSTLMYVWLLSQGCIHAGVTTPVPPAAGQTNLLLLMLLLLLPDAVVYLLLLLLSHCCVLL